MIFEKLRFVVPFVLLTIFVFAPTPLQSQTRADFVGRWILSNFTGHRPPPSVSKNNWMDLQSNGKFSEAFSGRVRRGTWTLRPWASGTTFNLRLQFQTENGRPTNRRPETLVVSFVKGKGKSLMGVGRVSTAVGTYYLLRSTTPTNSQQNGDGRIPTPDPLTIRWGASPTVFVRSLYTGVLGREAESSRVVSDWARTITSKPISRWRAMMGFVNSPEFRSRSWSKQRKDYYLYRRYNFRSGTYSYTVTKGPLSAEWRVVRGPSTFFFANAAMGYYRQFIPRR